MTIAHVWHVTTAELRDYLADLAPTLTVVSLEAHLLACAECRTTLSALRWSIGPTVGKPSNSEQMWNRIADRVDQPRRPLRSSNQALQVSVASPPLLAMTVGVAAALLVAVGVASATYPHWSLPVQLTLAPLAPVVAAVVAFQPGVDPAGQLAEVTPLAGNRLPLLRALLASFLALVSGLVASMFSSLPLDMVVVCVLPGVAFAAIVLAIATLSDPTRVAVALAVGWAVLILEWTRRQRTIPTAQTFRDMLVNERAFGWTLVGVTFAACVICYRRRHVAPAWRMR